VVFVRPFSLFYRLLSVLPVTDRPSLPLSPSPTHASLNEGSPTTASSPSAHPFTTSDNEPRGYSLHTLQGGRGPTPRKFRCSSCMEDCRSFDRDNYSAHPPSLLEHPPYNTAASSSKTEAYAVNDPEDDVLKNTIPVVRDALQGAVKGLDTVAKSPPQLDARGSSFIDVGRDHHQHQHYHVHVTVCPHASSSTSHHRAETPNVLPDLGPEPNTFTPLLERGYKFMVSARTFVATSIAAVVAQFDL